MLECKYWSQLYARLVHHYKKCSFVDPTITIGHAWGTLSYLQSRSRPTTSIGLPRTETGVRPHANSAVYSTEASKKARMRSMAAQSRKKKGFANVSTLTKSDGLQANVANDEQIEDNEGSSEETTSSLTPMLQQWKELKSAYRSHLLLFRMGDFYEMFYEDAKLGSSILNIALSVRTGAPMCGFPYFSLPTQLTKLVNAKVTVAICEQFHSNSQQIITQRKTGKDDNAVKSKKSALISRDVVRIVTPGSLIDEGCLPSRSFNFLMSIHLISTKSRAFSSSSTFRDSTNNPITIGAVWTDISTGDFHSIALASFSALSHHLARISPSEIIISEDVAGVTEFMDLLANYPVTIRPSDHFLGVISEPVKIAMHEWKRPTSSHVNGDAVIGPSLGPDRQLLDFTEVEKTASLPEIFATAGLLEYVAYTQRNVLPCLYVQPVQDIEELIACVRIDAATRKSLELTRSINQQTRTGSLLHTIDRTVTNAGARLLSSMIVSPITNISMLEARLDAVSLFHCDRLLISEIRRILKNCEDIERCLQRAQLNRGSPRDIRSIGRAIELSSQIKTLLANSFPNPKHVPALVKPILELLDNPTLRSLSEYIDSAIVDNPPYDTSSGHFIRLSFSSDLYDLHNARSLEQTKLQSLQSLYRDQLSLERVSILKNNQIGYYVNIPVNKARERESILLEAGFMLWHQTKAEMRFKTRELIELQTLINTSAERALKLELELFEEITQQTLSYSILISSLAQAIASLDVYSSLALLAQENHYTRPSFRDPKAGPMLRIISGRHPVVEDRMRNRRAQHAKIETTNSTTDKQVHASSVEEKKLNENPNLASRYLDSIEDDTYNPNAQISFAPMSTSNEDENEPVSTSPLDAPQMTIPSPQFDYTPNDCTLDNNELVWLLSGPNMSGKSSFLRQTALIMLLAQIGSFVPAQSCTLSPVDSIFSRVGASDDISQNLSTFLVEMKEVSGILANATSNSFLIIDELGRGTSTFDGLSIALAVLEDIHNRIGCRCIFATHYHELSLATNYLSKLKCYRMLTEEETMQESMNRAPAVASLTFFHKVVPGTVSSSYGIQVARMAGIPEHVAKRAASILTTLEHGQRSYRSLVAQVIRPQ